MLCDDGVIDVDMFEGRVTTCRPNLDIPPIDHAKRNLSRGVQALGAGLGGFVAFAKELSRMGPPADGFNQSMDASIARFYDRLNAGETGADDQGARLVAICEQAARTTPNPEAPARLPRLPSTTARYDVAIVGGTGFIGRHVVRQLTDQGKRVAVLARNTANLPALFANPMIDIFKGSMNDESLLADIFSRSKQVINLAHGGGGATRDAIADAMVGGAVKVANVASKHDVERILFISSSAALYLGDPDVVVNSQTPPDPRPDERGDYARAKVLAEDAMRQHEGAPIIVMRPAVVVGDGSDPFHSALGAYENCTHCIGWNKGENQLPFVLASDVARAIVAGLEVDIHEARGATLNLVGDVRWTARRYTQELAAALGRPLSFHSSMELRLVLEEWLKWGVKKIAGRSGVQTPSARDLKSRGMVAAFDTSEEKRLLNWTPCADEDAFHAEAIAVHIDAG